MRRESYSPGSTWSNGSGGSGMSQQRKTSTSGKRRSARGPRALLVGRKRRDERRSSRAERDRARWRASCFGKRRSSRAVTTSRARKEVEGRPRDQGHARASVPPRFTAPSSSASSSPRCSSTIERSISSGVGRARPTSNDRFNPARERVQAKNRKAFALLAAGGLSGKSLARRQPGCSPGARAPRSVRSGGDTGSGWKPSGTNRSELEITLAPGQSQRVDLPLKKKSVSAAPVITAPASKPAPAPAPVAPAPERDGGGGIGVREIVLISEATVALAGLGVGVGFLLSKALCGDPRRRRADGARPLGGRGRHRLLQRPRSYRLRRSA